MDGFIIFKVTALFLSVVRCQSHSPQSSPCNWKNVDNKLPVTLITLCCHSPTPLFYSSVDCWWPTLCSHCPPFDWCNEQLRVKRTLWLTRISVKCNRKLQKQFRNALDQNIKNLRCGGWCSSWYQWAHLESCCSRCTALRETVQTLKQSREGIRGGRRARGERIATVITNKNHLSHLCNLFSFNMRSMLKRSGSLREAWEGQALG